MKTLIILTSIVLCVIGIGCTILSHQITPAEIDKQALQYAIDAGVTDVNSYDAWYPNMVEAAQLDSDVDAAHSVIQLDLTQRMESDNLTYTIHKDVTAYNLSVARQREEMLFGEKGLLSLGLSMLGMGTLTGFLGLLRKRSGDYSPEEMQTALAEVTGTTTEQLNERQKQWIQVITGVQKFVATLDSGQQQEFKNTMNACQDTSTQIAVSATKKELVI